MKIKDLDLPVPYHPTMEINDPSKLQAFMDCPRGFFFSYVLGWRQEESNIHLVFGSAWHDAMEHILKNGYTHEAAAEAYDKFLAIYMDAFPMADVEPPHGAKNPATVLKGLASYVSQYRDIDKDNETLYTEVAGTVPISENRVIHTKVDSIIRAPDGIWSLEHKTTGRNSGPWRNKWTLILQIGAYTHLVKNAFPTEPVQGVKVNGAIFTKSRGAEFLRIPVRKTPDMMQEFLWEVNHWWDQLEWNYRALEQSSSSDDVMMAFPKNSQSCSKFGCKYPGLCNAWQNPLQKCHEPPPGYDIEFWDPRRGNEEDANFTAKPDKSGNITIEPKEGKPEPKSKEEDNNNEYDS